MLAAALIGHATGTLTAAAILDKLEY